IMGSTAPPTKRTRNNAGTASERNSDVNSPQLLELLKTRFEEQTEKIESAVREAEQRMLSRLMDRLDIIAGEVKQMDARVLTLEREVADLRSIKDRMGERVKTLNREVANLQAAGERLGALESRLTTQCRETSSCDLRVHGVPYVEGEDLKINYTKAAKIWIVVTYTQV
ncbi:hypothetical protein KR084_001323, partial [Drosophila pseudotakahashii]